MVSAIIVAAGGSRRMGFDKLSALICGSPVLKHSIQAFSDCPEVGEIIVVTAKDRIDWIESFGCDKVVKIVAGGAERHESVWNGLKQVSSNFDLIAIHDGARPLVNSDLIEQCARAAHQYGAATLANRVVDTLKRSSKTDTGYVVAGAVDRDEVWAMQTPQIFNYQIIMSAYEQVVSNQELVTDEVSAVQKLGHPVQLVENSDCNLKITFPSDLQVVETLKKISSLQN